ncbi:mediator of RNA polymerase II transcription subunit 25-like isoform X1 [Lytechinus pictus]|uniref:mediator of RNA polymerase II transcription subunit 25-like isoform X1 n=1 Tax=Lytechinus pictus TaxID=7653 RepID=UPI00240E4CB5|nr:mediator of RNA polymerase II transcription subunit 25-like isoform X1 [Lytechinus pictus]
MVIQEGKCTDVVFVIEGNASLGAYFDELKGNYILPTLVHFNGGPLIDSDFTGDYGKTVFSLVVFNSVDCFPGPAISCTAPTSNAKEFMRTLEKILFIGGGGESHSLLAEGLGGAMQIFDHMKIRREAGTKIDRMCILITNSPPFSIPAMECGHYSGYTAEQLAVLMGERNVNLSVMSPRKLGVLQRLYDKSCAELQVLPNKDYAKDERHLILLKGFELQERVPDSKESKQVTGNASPRRTLPSSGMKNSPGQSPNTKFKVPTTQSIASQGGAQGKYCTLY